MSRFYKSILLCLALSAFAEAASAASIYAPWANGPSQDPKFFPIAVFWQAPQVVGHSGPYPTEAAAAKAEGINIFLALGKPWPQRFGSDNGELAAIKANGLYVIGGTETPFNENRSATSVASVLALANSIGATRNVIGYNAGDEPNCGGTAQVQAGIVNAIKAFDPTRVVTYNHNAWMLHPQWESCLVQETAALRANSIASFDLYPLTTPWIPPTVGGGDFLSTPHDTLWLQGVAVRGLAHFAAPNQPLWVFVESGGDNLGFSAQNNVVPGSVAKNSDILTNVGNWSKFTAAWLGLTVSGPGIPANTTIKQIIDSKHLRMSRNATGTNANGTVTITGGVAGTDCVAARNICVAQGNRYRATPAEVNAEVWMSLINGANGIEYFCHDLTSISFCLGDVAGGAAAATVQANLTTINHNVLSFAPMLNSPTTGLCSMDSENFTTGAISTSSSCTNGVVKLTTSNGAVPGAVMVKKYGNDTYVFVQSSRRSTSGAVFTMQLPSLASHSATMVYNSVKEYQSSSGQPVSKTFALKGNGDFSDTLGQNGADYQVKIYKIT